MKKRLNNEAVIRLLREEGMMTRQDIAKKLGVSMPTALQSTNELLELGILVEAAELNSTGGRKAKCLWFNKDMKCVLGIDVATDHVKFVLIDYCGDYICEQRESFVFEDTIEWYGELRKRIDRFLELQETPYKDVIGVGVSFPGIIDEERMLIVKSHILDVENVGLDRFQNAIDFPMTICNDANCATYAELSKEKSSYLYLSLNESVGGGLILDGKLYTGATLQAGEVGHMVLVPGGNRCYCGKKGCADSYLSPKVLRYPEESVEDFFKRLENGDKEAKDRWDDYLEYLAIFVTNLRMMINTDIIIGGDVGKKIDPYIDDLKVKMQNYDLFARTIDYVFPCSVKNSVCAIGAARLALKKYEATVLDE